MPRVVSSPPHASAVGGSKAKVSFPRYRLARHRIDLVQITIEFLALVVVLYLTSTDLVASICEAAVIVAVIELAGLYRTTITLSALTDLPRMATACVIALFAIATVFNIHTEVRESLLVSALLVATLLVLRVVYYAVRRHRRRSNVLARRRTAIVGGGKVAAELLKSIALYPQLGLEPILVVDADPLYPADKFNVPIVSDPDLRELVNRENIQTLIVAFRKMPDSSMVSALRECARADCEIYIVPRLFEFVHLSPDMDRIHTIPLIRVRRSIYGTWYWSFKRLFDFSIALVGLIILSPILVVAATAVYLSDRKAPIIFRQIRVGRGGREFALFKFRSMAPVPESASNTDWHPNQPGRVNAFGRIMRKTSIDELPQLWNVLCGDMSLVGPRPERPHFVKRFEGSVHSYGDRHRVNVGLTGWAAIHGLRGDTSIDDRAMYDNFYIENWSIWLDVKIIILTIRAVLRGSGS